MIEQISPVTFLTCNSGIPGKLVVVYVMSFVVDKTVSTGLVTVDVTGTGIVVRLVITVVFVRVMGTVEVMDALVITVEVTGQVVVV